MQTGKPQVDLNHADERTIREVTGIDPSLAHAIVSFENPMERLPHCRNYPMSHKSTAALSHICVIKWCLNLWSRREIFDVLDCESPDCPKNRT